MHPKKWNMWRKLIRRLKEIMYRKGPKESKDKCTTTMCPQEVEFTPSAPAAQPQGFPST